MKWFTLVALVLVAVFFVPEAEARWGRGWGGAWGGGWGRGWGGGWGRGWGGGWGRGWGGYYGGYGYPYYGVYSYPYYGYRYYRGVDGAAAAKDAPTIVTCHWIEKDAMFSCKTASGLIECPVVANFTGIAPRTFDYFGIGWINTFDYARLLDTTRYELALYPRSAMPDDTTGKWFNRTFALGDKSFTDLAFFNAFDFSKFGFRIVDTECFKNLITAFQTVTDKFTVKLDDELKSEIALFAEIIKV